MESFKEVVVQKILEELDYALEGVSANHSIIGVEYVDIENQEITIKFKYNVIPEDEYIGLGSY